MSTSSRSQKYTFGRSVTLSSTLHVPPAGSRDVVAGQVLTNLLVSLTLWSLAHKCFDTRRGIVAFWFINATDATGQTYPLVVGHWSLWKSCMVQLYTGFWNACTKPMLRQSFLPFIVKDIDVEDYDVLVRTTGVDPFTTDKRRKEEGLFCLSADFFRLALEEIGNFTFEELFTFCKGHECTKDNMQQMFQISAYKLVHHMMQSKVSAAAIRGLYPRDRKRNMYDDLSFNFGVPCSDEQLAMLHAVTHSWYPDVDARPSTICHFSSFFDTAETEPVLPFEQLRAMYALGPKDDSKLRPHACRNFARRRDRKLEENYCQARGIRKPKRGRPPKTLAAQEARRKIQSFRDLNKRHRRKKPRNYKSNQSTQDQEQSLENHMSRKRLKVKAFMPTADGKRVPLRTPAVFVPGLFKPVMATVLKSQPLTPSLPPVSTHGPIIVPSVCPNLALPPYGSGVGSLLDGVMPAIPLNPVIPEEPNFAFQLASIDPKYPSDEEDEDEEFQGDSEDNDDTNWLANTASHPMYTDANQHAMRASLLNLL